MAGTKRTVKAVKTVTPAKRKRNTSDDDDDDDNDDESDVVDNVDDDDDEFNEQDKPSPPKNKKQKTEVTKKKKNKVMIKGSQKKGKSKKENSSEEEEEEEGHVEVETHAKGDEEGDKELAASNLLKEEEEEDEYDDEGDTTIEPDSSWDLTAIETLAKASPLSEAQPYDGTVSNAAKDIEIGDLQAASTALASVHHSPALWKALAELGVSAKQVSVTLHSCCADQDQPPDFRGYCCKVFSFRLVTNTLIFKLPKVTSNTWCQKS